MHADMNLGLYGNQIRILAEVTSAMLAFHRVIGLTTIHPAAINANAHACPRR